MNADFEILAPAGSMEVLKAVINAGADAVYIGGARFGARAYAKNFEEEEVLEALDYAHLRGKKIYLTVNTLFKNQEMDALYSYLLPYYERGLDAVIVQDLGAIKAIHEWFPDMEIHTSTQLTVTSQLGAEQLKQFGVTRIVMAREVSLSEMKQIHETTGLEMEAFVHGALCYSYSGQCLFSSMLGGRSGNRGRCAQPCRLPYSVVDEKGKSVKKDSYILSLKDFCSIKHMAQFKEAGVYSLKIEGRMKQACYAANVVAMYRKYIDLLAKEQEQYQVSDSDMEQLMAYGNRLGFTEVYLHDHNDKSMITYEKPSFTSSVQYKEPETVYEPIVGELTLTRGQEACLSIGHAKLADRILVRGACVLEAQNRPLDQQDVAMRMQKTKDTAFCFEELLIHMEEGVFLPNGALNQLRRDGIKALEEALLASHLRNNAKKTALCDVRDAEEPASNFVISTENRQHLPKVLSYDFYDEIWISTDAYTRATFLEELRKDCASIRSAKKGWGLILPYIFRADTVAFYEKIAEDLAQLKPDKIIAKNLEEIAFAKKFFPDSTLVADHSLYAFNDWALSALQQLGVQVDTIPLELNKSELLGRQKGNTCHVIYGYYPLMTTANCVCKNSMGCKKKTVELSLEDRYKVNFPVRNYCNECYNIIYNSLPTMLLPQLSTLKKAGVHSFRGHLSVEKPKELALVLEAMKNSVQGEKGTQWPSDLQYTNGHYKRGVE